MQKLTLTIENKTPDARQIILFGTADHLDKKMTISDANAEILSTCKHTYEEMIEMWDKVGIVNRYEVECTNPETIVAGEDYSHYIQSSDPNGMVARKPLNYNTRHKPEFICQKDAGVFMTDNATQLFFILSPCMKLEISMDFDPRTNSKP